MIGYLRLPASLKCVYYTTNDIRIPDEVYILTILYRDEMYLLIDGELHRSYYADVSELSNYINKSDIREEVSIILGILLSKIDNLEEKVYES